MFKGAFALGTAVSAGVAVAGGLLSLNQKQKEAKQQRQLLEKQEAAQRMQADLQLFGLLQQRQVDSLNDMVTDAAQKQSYLQTQASLRAQEMQQELANNQAKFAAEVQRISGDATSTQKQMQAEGDRSNARLQAGAQAVQALTEASGEEQALVSSVLKQLQSKGSNSNSIAALLDYAASAGGVNEALAMLSGGTGREGTEAAAELSRSNQLTNSKSELAKAAAKAGVDLADLQYTISNANTEIERAGTNYSANAANTDAQASYAVNQAGLSAARSANESNYGILNSSNAVQRQSRYLNSLANEQALKQGTAINSEILALQKNNISSPGFFDYVNLGVQGYGAYNSLRRNQ